MISASGSTCWSGSRCPTSCWRSDGWAAAPRPRARRWRPACWPAWGSPSSRTSCCSGPPSKAMPPGGSARDARRPRRSARSAFWPLYVAGVALLTPQYFGLVTAARPGVLRLRARPVPARAGHGARHARCAIWRCSRWAALRRVAKHRDAMDRSPGGTGRELRRGRGPAEGLGLPLLPVEGVRPRAAGAGGAGRPPAVGAGRCSGCTPRRPSPRWRHEPALSVEEGIVRIRHRDPARQARAGAARRAGGGRPAAHAAGRKPVHPLLHHRAPAFRW